MKRYTRSFLNMMEHNKNGEWVRYEDMHAHETEQDNVIDRLNDDLDRAFYRYQAQIITAHVELSVAGLLLLLTLGLLIFTDL